MWRMMLPIKPTALSHGDFAALGVNDYAYVKRVTTEDGRAAYAVHSADGERVAAFDSRDVAHAALRQFDLEPIDVA